MRHSEDGDKENKLHNLLPVLVAELPEFERELVLLRYQGGKKTREIAALLDMSHAAVRKRLERIRRNLGQALLATLEPEATEQKKRDRRATQIASAIIAIPPGWKQAAPVAATAGTFTLSAALKGIAILCVVLVVPTFLYFNVEEKIPTPEEMASANTTPVNDTESVIETDILKELVEVATSPLPSAPHPLSVLKSASIAGRLYEEDTGIGVNEGMIHLYNFGTKEGLDRQTDEEGHYCFEGLTPGKYAIRLKEDDAFRERYPRGRVILTKRTVELKPDTALSGIDFTVIRGITVLGRLVDPKGKALPDTVIRCWSERFTISEEMKTDSDGQFVFHGFGTDESAFFWAYHDGFAMRPHGPVKLPPDGIDDLLIAMQPESRISGRLVDQNGNPLFNVQVTSFPDDLTSNLGGARTDKAGKFILRGLHATSYTFGVMLPSDPGVRRLKNMAALEVGEGEELRDIELVYIMPGDLTISGQVTDDTGVPCKNIIVWTERGSINRQTKTDAQGYYELLDLDPGKYKVIAQGRTWRGLPVADRIVNAGANKIDFIFPRMASVEGQVIDAKTKEPIPVFEVMDQYGPLNWTEFRNDEGHFEITSLKPGEVRIVIQAKGYATGSSETFTLSSGQHREGLLIQLNQGGSVSGVIYAPDGKPLRDTAVGVDTGVVGGSARSNAEGEFVINHAPVGSWLLIAQHPDYSPSEVRITVAAGEECHADIYLQEGAQLQGTVTQQGTALENIRIELFQRLAKNVIGFSKESTTDIDGNYTFTGIPAGELTLRMYTMKNDQGHFIVAPVSFDASEAKNLDIEVYHGPDNALFDIELGEDLIAHDGMIFVQLLYQFDTGDREWFYTFAQLEDEIYLEGIRPGIATLNAVYHAPNHGKPLAASEPREVTIQEAGENYFSITFPKRY